MRLKSLSAEALDILGLAPPGDPPKENAASAGDRNGVQGAKEVAKLREATYDLWADLPTAELSNASRPVGVTVFPDLRARSAKRQTLTLRDLGDLISSTVVPNKAALPLLKLAAFGNVSTAKGSLRHDANLESIDGIEGDYDAGAVTMAEAADRLRAAGVSALLYSTPSHRPDSPRWRVLAPTSESLPAAERDALAARLNGALGGVLAPETFTRSQSYYFGGVGSPPDVVVLDGQAIDQVENLTPIGRAPIATDDDEIDLLADLAAANDDEDDLSSYIEPDWGRIEGALAVIPADGRVEWLKVGMALHAESRGSDRGFDVWSEWSKGSDKFDARDQARTWKSFGERSRKVTRIGSLFALAKEHGWEPEPVTIDGFPLSEDGVAQAFAARFRQDLRFCHSTGRWFQWAGTHWRREETQLAFEWARETCRSMALRDPKSSAAKALAKASAAGAVERFARADRHFAVTADGWDRDHWLLGTPGGTVELKSGRIRPARPAENITRQTAVAPIPLNRFDARRDCPRWLRFLDQALKGDADVIRFLQQWAGYSLTGSTREEVLLFVHGPGGSGKSTAINALGDALGDYAITVATETLTASKYDRHSTEIARLKGARMARASETEQGRAWAQQRITAMTGGDVMTARFMRQDDFEFRPEFKLTIVGNHAPAIENVDGAIRRRFIVLPFDQRPPTADHGLKDALKAEFPGILSWAMLGCLDWQTNGLMRPRAVVEATETYLESQDSFSIWLDECCETGPNFTATTADLWTSWESFTFRSGEQPGSRTKTFPERLTQAGFTPIKDTMGLRGRGYRGVKVEDDLDGDLLDVGGATDAFH